MEVFRTIIKTNESMKKISYKTPVMLAGSCFTENIGNRLSGLKMNVDINPTGIVYNPLSIKNTLDILIDRKHFTREDIFCHNELWNSFSHHSSFSSPDMEECLDRINSRIVYSSEFLKNADFLFITFGTAWVYIEESSGKTVANCHKLPAKNFIRAMLDAKTIVEEYRELINRLISYNSKLEIVFTVSPIRHWKDGAVDNTLSKSTLIVAIHELIKTFPPIQYFPSYEIMMDDLRDYRFYKEDMLHPSDQAVDYIFERFSESYILPDAKKMFDEIMSIKKAMDHRPFNPGSEGHRKFIKATIKKINEITARCPDINLEMEKAYFYDMGEM